MADKLKQYQDLCGMLWETLQHYGDPEFYHAIAIMADRPAGGFADDFDKSYSNLEYDRPMPGKLARETMEAAIVEYGELVILTR
jgi:hypothetical protein